MIVMRWPAMMAVTADRVAVGDVVYGHSINRSLMLFDEPFTVTGVRPADALEDVWRIEGHESDRVPGYYFRATSDYLIIADRGNER